MSLAQSLLQGLASLIDNAAIAEFTTEAGKKAISVLKAHFTFSAIVVMLLRMKGGGLFLIGFKFDYVAKSTSLLCRI